MSTLNASLLSTESTLERMYDFHGQTILVTGGAGVLGAGLVRGLVERGANVAVLGRNPDALKAMSERFPKQPGAGFVYGVVGDVLDPESIQRAVDTTLAEFGAIDGLINGAGGNNPQATAEKEHSFYDIPP